MIINLLRRISLMMLNFLTNIQYTKNNASNRFFWRALASIVKMGRKGKRENAKETYYNKVVMLLSF